MAGTLYVCPTPIGNLEDITFRVINTLKDVDMIAAEDTRHTLKLLNHFDIHKPMTSYHEHNKIEKAEKLVEKLLDGVNIAIVTDAGTPAISDPGEELVRQAVAAGITVTSLPGACACITALTMSALPTRRFAFEAFLPADRKERRQVIARLKTEIRTTVIYEAPHHLLKTLKELYAELGNRQLTLCRESAYTRTLKVPFLFMKMSRREGNMCWCLVDAMRKSFLVIQGRSFWQCR